MGSGLIYAAIITMWAAYFIPMWLRRHEERSESRSVERFSRAMRILSRRGPTPDQRYVVMPRRRPAPARAGGPGQVRRRPSAPVLRRRRILAALILLTVAVAIATPLTAVPWWGPLAALAVTVVDLAHLRLQARRRRELSRTRASVRRRTRARMRRFDSAERIVQARRAIAEERAAAEAERLAAEEAAAAAAREEAELRAAEALGWRPVPVPLPTYVTKPMAARPPRMSDLWLPEEQPFDQTAGSPEPANGPVGTDELDEIIERRRAVND